jgi:uncharacterized protein YndB with AHSA1/START domain
MRIHNVHSRELPAPAERAWELVTGLASAHDELWPVERWPTSPIEFDRPLGPGAKGGHGLIRYEVERYEPGRRVVFRFARGSGLDGIHVLEVEPIDARTSRLTHTLDTRVGWKLLPLYPVLRAAHDAQIEDLLDNAERAAGGSPAPPPPLPRLLPVANAVEGGVIPLRRNALGWIVPGTLAAIAALHAAWALGWRWPVASDQALADHVIGYGAELPPDWLTGLVAAMLLTCAVIVRAGARGRWRPAAWAVAGVLLARGVVYIPIDLAGGLDDTYSRLDLAIYSPLCLALGAGTVRLLTHAPGGVRPRIGSALAGGGEVRA